MFNKKQVTKQDGKGRVAAFWLAKNGEYYSGSFSNTDFAKDALTTPHNYKLFLRENGFKKKETDPDLVLSAVVKNLPQEAAVAAPKKGFARNKFSQTPKTVETTDADDDEGLPF